MPRRERKIGVTGPACNPQKDLDDLLIALDEKFDQKTRIHCRKPKARYSKDRYKNKNVARNAQDLN